MLDAVKRNGRLTPSDEVYEGLHQGDNRNHTYTRVVLPLIPPAPPSRSLDRDYITIIG